MSASARGHGEAVIRGREEHERHQEHPELRIRVRVRAPIKEDELALLHCVVESCVHLKKQRVERVRTRGGSYYSLAMEEPELLHPELVQPKFSRLRVPNYSTK